MIMWGELQTRWWAAVGNSAHRRQPACGGGGRGVSVGGLRGEGSAHPRRRAARSGAGDEHAVDDLQDGVVRLDVGLHHQGGPRPGEGTTGGLDVTEVQTQGGGGVLVDLRLRAGRHGHKSTCMQVVHGIGGSAAARERCSSGRQAAQRTAISFPSRLVPQVCRADRVFLVSLSSGMMW